MRVQARFQRAWGTKLQETWLCPGGGRSALKPKHGQKVVVWARATQDPDVVLRGAVFKRVDGVLEDQQGWGLPGMGQ